MWRASEVNETFHAFTTHVKQTASSILFHRGKTTSSLAHVGDRPDADDGDGDDEAYEREIMAINQKFK